MRSDFELLDAWREGDKEAGNELFSRHFDAVCRFFRNKVSDGVDNLIQRSFLACVESRDRFRKEASFRTYLFTVARHELYAHAARQRRSQARFDPLETSAFDLGPSASRIVATRAEERLLLEALRRIPLEHQIVLELYYWEEMSAAELGRVLGEPEGTVRTRLRRAKALLEGALQELGQTRGELASTLGNLENWAKGLREAVGARSG